MRVSILLILFCLCTPVGYCSADEPGRGSATLPTRQDAASTAIERSLAFLTADALDWKATRGCAACHHAPMLIWTLSEAKSLGYRIDDAALVEILTWVSDPEDRAKTYPPRRLSEAPKILSFSPLQHALAIGTADRDSVAVHTAWERFLDTLVTDQHEEFLIRSQRDDGSWPMSSRPVDEYPPSKDLRPITYAGSAWATLGLLRSSAE